jgi:signal transduction histidine kinase
MIAAAAQSADHPARPMDVATVTAIALVGAWTALARRAPRTALAGSLLTFYAALAFGVPAFSPALPLAVPLFAVAKAGYLWLGIATAGVVGASSVTWRLLGEMPEPFARVAVSTLFDLALLTVLLLLGEVLRSRGALRAEAALRLRVAEQAHQQRITAERLRIARDLHDVLSHTVAVVGIQAGVAAESIRTRPSRAEQAVELVRSATTDAMADLRSTIAVLREETADDLPLQPAPGLAKLPDLLHEAQAAGLTATLTVRGDPTPLRPAVELAVYRIVQESLTNVLRHARASSVRALVEHCGDAILVEVRDDGRGARPPVERDGAPMGSGLQGMAERVAALGGALSFGPAGNGGTGFTVRVRLPTGGGR